MRTYRVLLASALWISALVASPHGHAQLLPPTLNDVGVTEHLGAQVPLDRSFTTSDGEQVRLGRLLGNGKPTLLILAYDRCTMLCNLVLRSAADLVHRLSLRPSRDYNVVTISIDPRETPADAAEKRQTYLDKGRYAGQSKRWPFLVGAKPDIEAVASSLGFRYRWDARTEQYAHPAVLFVLSPQGTVARYFYGLKQDPREVEQALKGVTEPFSRATAGSVLACFRFDTLSQKYGGRVRFWFQTGAALVLLGLIAGISKLWRAGATS